MNRIAFAFCVSLALQLAAVFAGAATLALSVTNFGVRPNSRENAVPGVKKALNRSALKTTFLSIAHRRQL